MKICRDTVNLVEIGPQCRALYMKIQEHFVFLTAARSVLQLDSSAEGAESPVAMATVRGSILLTTTCRSTAEHRERIVACPWQRWLRERVAVSRYTYITTLVSPRNHRYCHIRGCKRKCAYMRC